MKLLEFVAFIRANPRLPVRDLANRLGCHERSVQKFLEQIEVSVVRGRDPVNGRANVKLYEVGLPAEKRRAFA